MNNKAGILKIFGIIFLILIIIIGATIFYFYQFHIFKEMKMCVSNQEQNSNISCTNNQECIDLFFNISNTSIQDLEETPENLRNMYFEVLNEAIYCNNTCIYKDIYDNFNNEFFIGCSSGDKEFSLKIRGKELWQMKDYLFEEASNYANYANYTNYTGEYL